VLQSVLRLPFRQGNTPYALVLGIELRKEHVRVPCSFVEMTSEFFAATRCSRGRHGASLLLLLPRQRGEDLGVP